MISPASPARAALLLALLLPLACGPRGPRADYAAQPATPVESTADERTSLAVTLYQDGRGLVQDRRRVELPEGHVTLRVADVSAALLPASVRVSLPRAHVLLLGQDFHYRPLTPTSLLDAHLGQEVELVREERGGERRRRARVVQGSAGPLLDADGVTLSPEPGERLVFPSVPAELLARPALVLDLASDAGSRELELSYLSEGLGWAATYAVVLGKDGKSGQLDGWATLENASGVELREAEVTLAAGRPSGPDAAEPVPQPLGLSVLPPAPREAGVHAEAVRLPERITLPSGSARQTRLLTPERVALSRRTLVWNHLGAPCMSGGCDAELVAQVSEVLTLKRTAARAPLVLPAGAVHLYDESGGPRRWLGSSRVEATAEGEALEVAAGSPTAISAKLRFLGFDQTGDCTMSSTYEVLVDGRGGPARSVELVQTFDAEVELAQSSLPASSRGPRQLRFVGTLPRGAPLRLTFRVKTRTC